VHCFGLNRPLSARRGTNLREDVTPKPQNGKGSAAARLCPPKIKLEDGIQQMIKWISKRGARPFKYQFDLETLNEKTPDR
jgi:hypothetical protein